MILMFLEDDNSHWDSVDEQPEKKMSEVGGKHIPKVSLPKC